MKCPLLSILKADAIGARREVLEDCLEGECAWWDEQKNLCSLKVIAKELSRLQVKAHGKEK